MQSAMAGLREHLGKLGWCRGRARSSARIRTRTPTRQRVGSHTLGPRPESNGAGQRAPVQLSADPRRRKTIPASVMAPAGTGLVPCSWPVSPRASPLLIWAGYADTHLGVKYTDIDYFVITDAAQAVLAGSPYDRSTFGTAPCWPGWPCQTTCCTPPPPRSASAQPTLVQPE